MGVRREAREHRREHEFAAFTAGAAGRLLHAAALLTGDPAEAERLVTGALATVYADWFRMRGDDPYARARQELTTRFAHHPRRYRAARGGLLDRLSPQTRLVLVLRLYEGLAEETAAAQLGLPVDRLRARCAQAVATLRSRP